MIQCLVSTSSAITLGFGLSHASIDAQDFPQLSFNKYSGVQEWKNDVLFLWVNLGMEAKPGVHINDFSDKLDGVQAVIISHMRGHTSDMDEIMAICMDAGKPVVEDAAHSLGTTWEGRNIGTIGRIGCFSLQSYRSAAKILYRSTAKILTLDP